MTIFQILPILGAIGIAITFLHFIWPSFNLFRSNWKMPAFFGALFFVFTLITLYFDGLKGFWINHSTNFSGNQVWFDLIIAVAIAFYFMQPRAKRVGMNTQLWAVAVLLTACVALLPMMARILWLEAKQVV